ncbi:right-handed parallel beta-helix repeat-containing protein, partial [candidate division KSB1 bacterium]|nr:right-handed parallel beta-helix repeat-containing protein [candidate division KSB1 bacterium]
LATSDALEFLQASYSGVTIQDNTFLNNKRHIRLHEQTGNVIENFIIRRNLMNGTTGEESLRLIGAANVAIENNVVMKSTQQGIYVDAGCSNITVSHNTFYQTGFEMIRTKLISADMAIKNNIFYGNGTHAALAAAVASLPSEDYNLIFNTGSNTETTTQPAITSFGANTKTGLDPLFVSTVANIEDLHLLNGSPALGAGVDLGVSEDIGNGARPQPAASNPDLGAYENSRATPETGGSNNAIKIMPLGDSITQMYTDHDGYRRPLWFMLQNGGFNVDFVGSQNLNKGGPPPHPDFDMDHEGHSGWRTDEILGFLGGWARTYRPEIALIHLGSNDVFQYQSNSGTIAELGRVIDSLRAVNPTIKIALAQIIPSMYEAPEIMDLNQRIPNLAATKHTPQSPVVVVDQWTGFSVNEDMYDGVHPNDGGDEKMATKWYAALTGLLSTATTKWVDQSNGSDANDGNSEATAYASLQFALEHVNSGTAAARSIINVKNGTYSVIGLTNPSGSATAVLVQNLDYLTIQAAPGHAPKLQPATAGMVSLSIVNSHHLIVDGLASDQTTAQADNWQVFGANDLTVRNCTFVGGQRGINFSSALHTALVEKNTFKNISLLPTSDALEFLQASYSGVTIQDNTFLNNKRHLRLHLQTGNTIGNFIIRRNVMNGTAGEESVRLIGATEVVFENNVMMNSAQQGIYVDAGCRNISIRHNTFYKAGFEMIRTKLVSADLLIKNNIFYADGTHAAIAAAASPLPSEDYNLVFNAGSVTETTLQPAITAWGVNTKAGIDPLFVSTLAGGENLHLQNNSPAIAMGIELGTAEDAERNARPQPVSTTPDVGAYESPLPILATPDIALNPVALDFGEVTIGANATQTLVVSNSGSAALQVTAANVAGTHASEFAIASGGAPFTLLPGATRNLVVRFNPGSVGSKNALLNLTSNDADENPVTVALAGIGRQALASAYVLLADNKIQIKGQKSSIGDIHSNNELLFDVGAPSKHTGNLTTVGKTTIKKYNTINGNVKSGGQLVVENNATINGTARGYTPVARVTLPRLSFWASGKNVTVGKHKSLSLAPGYYGDVNVENEATLFLRSGEYFFKSLEVKDQAVLNLDATNGPAKINVAAALQFRKASEMTITPYGDNGSSWVTFHCMGDVTLDENSRILGAVIAPAKKVTLKKSMFFKGSISAKEIIVEELVTLLYHTVNGTAGKENPAEDETKENPEQTAPVMNYELAQNYPNPFNPSTTIRFTLPEAAPGAVTLRIYDMRGALVKTLVSGTLHAGQHEVVWNGINKQGEHVASGMYLYRMQAGGFVQTKQMMLMR